MRRESMLVHLMLKVVAAALLLLTALLFCFFGIFKVRGGEPRLYLLSAAAGEVAMVILFLMTK